VEEKAQDLAQAFTEIRDMLAKYVPPLEVRTDKKGGYNVWSTREVTIDGRKRDEIFFASVIPQKGYVGFYYMPVYTHPEQKELFKPELLSMLKGKSCFYIRRLDPSLTRQIRDALADGYRLYKQRGWV
jgi:hypothetical protein